MLITSELTNQSARKALFTCVVYTNTRYGVYRLLKMALLTSLMNAPEIALSCSGFDKLWSQVG